MTYVDVSDTIQRPAVGTLLSTGNRFISESDSGSTYYFPTNTGNCSIFMPVPSAGLYYKFISKGVGAATGYAITFSGAIANVAIQANIPAGTTNSHATARTTITSGAAANLLAGDSLECECDGTNWYCFARSSGANPGWTTA